MRKKALITGIAGQDGSYLAELLISKGYEICGLVTDKQIADSNLIWRLEGFANKLNLLTCNLESKDEIINLLRVVKPSEVYHLASDYQPTNTIENEFKSYHNNVNALANLLTSLHSELPDSRLFFAGSSLMYGDQKHYPQDERTLFSPNTPYGIAKTAGAYFIRRFREAYGMFACTGILFNHESIRRDSRYLSRKITMAAANIKLGRQRELKLGNIDIKKDWSFAGDVVKSMWLMLQSDAPRDYVIGSGKLHSVRELLDIAFKYVGLEWQKFVAIDKCLIRATDHDNLCADPHELEVRLGWKPELTFEKMIEAMVDFDLRQCEGELND